MEQNISSNGKGSQNEVKEGGTAYIAETLIINYYGYKQEVKIAPIDSTTKSLSCPYRDLYHFRPNDADRFFGRESEIQELFQATQTHNFVPVLGASGSGKSSIVFAGLVPKLVEQRNWQFTYFRPGDEPFQALANALVPLYATKLTPTAQLTEARELNQSLVNGSILLKDVFAKIENNFPDQKLLLIADQFEELFTSCLNEKIQHRFLNVLLDCFKSPLKNLQFPPVLVSTMRADFLGQALAFPTLADVLKSDIKLGAMNRENLTKVITKPAANLGVEFDADLVERILDDVMGEPGNLALLEFALTELWQKRSGNQLSHQAYEAIGQVKGALARYAEKEVYEHLENTEKEQARKIFVQLVNLGEDNNHTRRRVNQSQIGQNNWDFVTSKDGLAASRLVVTSRDDNNQETLEVVHEALIRHWSRLNGWLNEDRESLNKQRQLDDMAQDWVKSGRKTDYLLSNKRLRAAKEFQKEQQVNYPLSDLAKSFVSSSSKQQRKKLIKSLGIFLVIPLIGTVFVVREINLNGDKKIIHDCVGQESCPGRIQALENLVNAKMNLSKYNLRGANLSGVNLSGANLFRSSLSNANLEAAILSSANLSSANLSLATLVVANLSRANLSRANLSSVSFFRANLRNTNLIDANLSRANLVLADLFRANLDTASLSRANLSSANLSRANLSRSYFISSNLSRANLSSANLSSANLSSANLSSANLSSANLIDVKNFIPFQIKSACNWEKATYKGHFDEVKKQWVVDETANKEYIEKLRQDKASDPKEPVNCSEW